MRSRTIATATIARPAAIPLPVRRWLRLWSTGDPRPCAPTKVASTTMPNAIMIVCDSPVMIVGTAIGSCTLNSVWRVVAPHILDASTA